MFLALGPDIWDDKKGIIVMYLEYEDYINLLDGHLMDEHGVVLDSVPLENVVKDFLGVDVTPVAMQMYQLMPDDCHMILEQMQAMHYNRPARFVGKVLFHPETDSDLDELREQVAGHVPDAVRDYGLVDLTSESEDGLPLSDDEWHIVKVMPENLNIIQTIFRTFGADRCYVVLKDHAYYVIYDFTDELELERFECFTSEFMLEPCFIDADIVAGDNPVFGGIEFSEIF